MLAFSWKCSSFERQNLSSSLQMNYCKRKLVKYLKRYLVNRNPGSLCRSSTGLWVYLNYWCFVEKTAPMLPAEILNSSEPNLFLQVFTSGWQSEKLLDLGLLYYSAHPHPSALSHSPKTNNKSPKQTNPNTVNLTRVRRFWKLHSTIVSPSETKFYGELYVLTSPFSL